MVVSELQNHGFQNMYDHFHTVASNHGLCVRQDVLLHVTSNTSTTFKVQKVTCYVLYRHVVLGDFELNPDRSYVYRRHS